MKTTTKKTAAKKDLHLNYLLDQISSLDKKGKGKKTVIIEPPHVAETKVAKTKVAEAPKPRKKIERSRDYAFLDDVTKASVIKAIAQFNKLPEDKKPISLTAFVIHEGHAYPPKAILHMALDIVGWETKSDAFNTYMALDVLNYLGFETKSNRKSGQQAKGSIMVNKQLVVDPKIMLEGFSTLSKDQQVKIVNKMIDHVLKEFPETTFSKEG